MKIIASLLALFALAIGQQSPTPWILKTSLDTVEARSNVVDFYIQSTHDGGYAGVYVLADGTKWSISGYPTPVNQPQPPGIPEWWPTTANPTAGWGGEPRPRCASPIGKGPHPHPPDGATWTTYLEMLQAGGHDTLIEAHEKRLAAWSPEVTRGGAGDPAAAISASVCYALDPDPLIIAKVEAYIMLFDPVNELAGPEVADWYGPSGVGRLNGTNWPSGGITYGHQSLQTLAILYGAFADHLSPEAKQRAETHALWWMRENKQFRATWSPESTAKGYPDDQRGWQWYWDAHAWRTSQMAGIVWLLMEFYDPSSALWQEYAEFYGDLIHTKYLPYYQTCVLSLDYDDDDLAMWNSVDYYYFTVKHTAGLHLSLEVGTGQSGYWDNPEPPFYATGYRFGCGSIYRVAPESYAPSPAHKIGHGWNISQMRQAHLANQAAQTMKYFLARGNDPKLLSLCAEYEPSYLYPYDVNLFHAVSWNQTPDMPWWWFRDTSVRPVDWKTLPLVGRSPGPGHTVARTAWEEGPDAAWLTYRIGNTSLHHSEMRPGDFCFYHRGWLLPRTISYMNNYRAAVDFCQRKYHGIHIFDPADPSSDLRLNYSTTETGSVPFALPRDGGPKRVLEPYTSDIGQGYVKKGAGEAGNWKWDRYQQQLARMEPESNHDLEQSRQRYRASGTIGALKWHAEAHDWTPMFTKWPHEWNYSTTSVGYGSSTSRYDGLSRTTRVVHPNGYVRVVVWLDPGTGSKESPPCIVVYDQVETLDPTWPVELHWHAMKKPEHVGGNHWTFTDDRKVVNVNYWDWEPKYRSGTGYISGTVSPVPNRQYQYDGTLHLQLWNGTKTLSPTVADSISSYDANLVYEDGILAGHEPLNFALFNGGKQSGGAGPPPKGWGSPVEPWDPRYSPVSVANWTMSVHPAPKSVHSRFLTVMNSDVNGSGTGPYPAKAVVENGATIVVVSLPGGAATVSITEDFSVTVE